MHRVDNFPIKFPLVVNQSRSERKHGIFKAFSGPMFSAEMSKDRFFFIENMGSYSIQRISMNFRIFFH